MLLIIDNQNVFIKRFIRDFLSEQDIDFRVLKHNQTVDLEELQNVSGLILSGGRGHPYAPLNLTANFVALQNFRVPIIGFCLGHEIIAAFYGGHVEKLPEYFTKKVDIQLIKNDPLFDGIKGKSISLARRHSYHVSKLPPDFDILAWSSITPHEIIRHKTESIYGFQAHPEVSPTEGYMIMQNFIKLCGLAN
jgi:GMP synthase (glutamine-hydrolysing)